MLINCKLSVEEGTSLGKRKPSKPKPGSLTIARVRDEGLRLTLNFGSTNSSRATKVYMATMDNIANTFDKFVDQGKLTIILKQPGVQIFISNATNPKLLRKASRAIHVLKSVGHVTPEMVEHEGLSTSLITDRRTKVTIESRAEYEAQKELGPFIECLSVHTHVLRSVDSRWFKLKLLTMLDLSGNNLGAMDDFNWRKFEEIRKLEALIDFNLSSNNLQVLPVKFVMSFPKRLAHLHLSDNLLQTLPDELCNVRSLVTLNVARNPLDDLPGDLFYHCRLLRNLNCSGTKIKFHDAEMRNIRFSTLASSAIGAAVGRLRPRTGIPTLFDIASAAIYDNEKACAVLPFTVKSTMRKDLFRCHDCSRLLPKRWRRECILQPLPASNCSEHVETEQRYGSQIVLQHNTCNSCWRYRRFGK